MNFSERLRTEMDRRGLSQLALSKAADVRQSAISAYLAGSGEPSVAALSRIAQALGVTMDELYTGLSPKTPKRKKPSNPEAEQKLEDMKEACTKLGGEVAALGKLIEGLSKIISK